MSHCPLVPSWLMQPALPARWVSLPVAGSGLKIRTALGLPMKTVADDTYAVVPLGATTTLESTWPECASPHRPPLPSTVTHDCDSGRQSSARAAGAPAVQAIATTHTASFIHPGIRRPSR